MGLRIAIFDDNRNILESISMLLGTVPGYEVTGLYKDVLHCLEDTAEAAPDIILMDIEMPGMTGIEAVKLIKEKYPAVQILMQTVFDDDERVFDSICAGASGYILKNEINSKLVDYIRDVQAGGSPMSPVIARKVLNKMQEHAAVIRPPEAADYNLTPREKEVLTCITEGYSYKMVADKLSIRFETVKTHIKNIYEKLHVASMAEAVAKALNQKLV
ncbi:MAG: response regulator transcription factor [Ferruginibacter sp.]